MLKSALEKKRIQRERTADCACVCVHHWSDMAGLEA